MSGMATGLNHSLNAMADPVRRQVLLVLASGPQRASDLAREVGVSPSSMSKHLKVLLQAGLARDERTPSDSRVRIFHLRPEGLATASDWIRELQSRWDLQLAAFKQHIENRADV